MQHFRRPQPAQPPKTGPKPALKMVQLPVFRVRRQHLEEYLMRVYRMEDFDFLVAAGCTPGAILEYAVQAAIPPSPDAARQADNIRRGQRIRNVPLILNVLCLDGYIPAGRYIIDTRPEVPVINQYRALLQQTGDPLAPRCLAFKEAHSKERLFTQQAAQLDKIVFEMRKERR